MKKLDEAKILERANVLYAEAKLGSSAAYTAPEFCPTIQSNQVKALLKALVEALNADEVEGAE